MIVTYSLHHAAILQCKLQKRLFLLLGFSVNYAIIHLGKVSVQIANRTQ